MSSGEVNVVAIMYPKAGKQNELASHLAELSRQVQVNEPDTLIYYSFPIKDGTELMVVERYRDQEALQAHLLSSYFQEFGSRAGGLMERPYEVKVGNGLIPGSVSVSRV